MDRRVSRTKNAIRDAYFRLLGEKEKDKITIAEIARLADIDRKTFYLHYHDVDDIIREYCIQLVTELMHRMEKTATQSVPQGFSLNVMFDMINQLISENLDLFELLSSQQDSHYFFDEIRKMLVEVIQQKLRNTFAITETQLRIYSEFYISGIFNVYNQWIHNQIPLTIHEVANLLTNASLKGLEAIIPGSIDAVHERDTLSL